MSKLQRLIEKCRRQQQQKPGQLEIPVRLPGGIMGKSVWDGTWYYGGDPAIPPGIPENRITKADIDATEEEALDEWRARTQEDWGFSQWYDEDAPLVM